jgi:hypothetical protein
MLCTVRGMDEAIKKSKMEFSGRHFTGFRYGGFKEKSRSEKIKACSLKIFSSAHHTPPGIY